MDDTTDVWEASPPKMGTMVIESGVEIEFTVNEGSARKSAVSRTYALIWGEIAIAWTRRHKR
jgi:hypothetical protein